MLLHRPPLRLLTRTPKSTLLCFSRAQHAPVSTSAPARPKLAPVPVDDLCIPLTPPYSIASFIPSPAPLSREHFTKLHRLAALTPPTTEEEWSALDQLGGLVAIMEGVRLVDTSAVEDGQGEMGIVDSRVRERGGEGKRQEGHRMEESDGYGTRLLQLAQVREGDYYVVRTPVGIRGKKRKVVSGVDTDETYE